MKVRGERKRNFTFLYEQKLFNKSLIKQLEESLISMYNH